MALPKEPHFNYETGADFWYLRGQAVVRVICLFIRLRPCSVLRDKSATHVFHSLLLLWVKYYGPPVLLCTDLGKGLTLRSSGCSPSVMALSCTVRRLACIDLWEGRRGSIID